MEGRRGGAVGPTNMFVTFMVRLCVFGEAFCATVFHLRGRSQLAPDTSR